MAAGGDSKNSAAQGGVAALGFGVFAVVCCAAFPLLVALAGGLAIGTVLGVGAGVLAAIVLVGALAMRWHRRRACETSSPEAAPSGDRVPASERPSDAAR